MYRSTSSLYSTRPTSSADMLRILFSVAIPLLRYRKHNSRRLDASIIKKVTYAIYKTKLSTYERSRHVYWDNHRSDEFFPPQIRDETSGCGEIWIQSNKNTKLQSLNKGLQATPIRFKFSPTRYEEITNFVFRKTKRFSKNATIYPEKTPDCISIPAFGWYLVFENSINP